MENLYSTAKQLVFGVATLSLTTLQACSGTSPEDPFEPANRVTHEINKTVDRAILNPVSKVYDTFTDADIKERIATASNNLGEPKSAVNHILQGDIEGAAINTSRFIYNSTMGLGGIYDPASSLGLFPAPTNFNQTMASWNVPSGPYLELPVLGPNTARSAMGLIIDTQLNPVTNWLSKDQLQIYNSFLIVSKVNDRARYGNLVEMLLYQSPDSYLATRLAYLQNQRSAEEQVTGTDQSETVELENFYE